MILLLGFFAILSATTAAPSRPIVVPDLLEAAPVVAAPVAVVSSQSHAQDELGQYSYSYSNPLSAKVETKTVDGITRGGYSYLDSHGLVQSVNYVSDDVNGFRVAASNLPLGRVTPQEDEPLVAHEKAKAVAALHEAAAHDTAEVAVVYANAVVPEPVHVPVPPAPAPIASVVTAAAPVPTALPAAYLAEVRSSSTPAPPLVAHLPSAAPVVHVTPAPFRPTPTTFSIPAEHAHSYATVELDSPDIPAPVPSPGAYLHPSHISVAPTHAPVVVSTPAPIFFDEPTPVEIKAAAPAVPVVSVASVTPAPIAPDVPAVVASPAPVVHSDSLVAAPVAVVSSQSHAQDELGQYSYSYSNPLSAKVETKTVDGITRGGYSYLDSHGLVQSVNYVSDDHNGFRVAASNLPSAAVPVDIPDSDDVAAAKAIFFAEIAKAKEAAEYAH